MQLQWVNTTICGVKKALENSFLRVNVMNYGANAKPTKTAVVSTPTKAKKKTHNS